MEFILAFIIVQTLIRLLFSMVAWKCSAPLKRHELHRERDWRLKQFPIKRFHPDDNA